MPDTDSQLIFSSYIEIVERARWVCAGVEVGVAQVLQVSSLNIESHAHSDSLTTPSLWIAKRRALWPPFFQLNGHELGTD